MKCNICFAELRPFARALVLNKHDVGYFRCDSCGFVQTEEPYWLDEAYSAAINKSDTGLVNRNQRLAVIVRALIAFLFPGSGRYADFGGGTGLFTRLMRDAGYDFHTCDKHCNNIFAQGFEASPSPESPFDVLTSFEVFEHMVRPLEDIEGMLAFSDNIVLTTSLLPSPTPKPDSWWYYCTDTGQHVSFYTEKALMTLADTLGVHYVTNRRDMHILSRRVISQGLFSVLSRYKAARFLGPITRRESLIEADYEKITGRRIA
jgi:hypothetical protein